MWVLTYAPHHAATLFRVCGRGLEMTGMMCKIEQLHVHEMSKEVTLF
jgi:hypothetical protein